MIISPIHAPTLFGSSRAQPRDYFRGDLFPFRRGTDALAAALTGVARARSRTTLRVLFPDYFCGELLERIEGSSVTCSFYQVRDDCTPNWEDVSRIMDNDPYPDALVLVHYFGFPNAVAEARTYCASMGIALVEDCAHVMYPQGAVGTSGVYSIFSPWKFFPLPDLGLLLAWGQASAYIDVLAPSRQPWQWSRWLAKREFQRVLSGMHVNWYRGDQSHRAERVASHADASPSLYSQRAFHRLLGRADQIAYRRQQNYRSLEQWFERHHPGALLFTRVPPSVVPYVFPCRTEQSAAAVGRRLRQHGIPAFPWPSLPDGVRGDESQHATANWLADHILLLPVHQGVSTTQIAYMHQQLALLW